GKGGPPPGALKKKIHPQGGGGLITPPISGPNASAIAPIAVQMLMAAVRSLGFVKAAGMIASAVGRGSAAARPCPSRAAVRMLPLPARPAPREASVKIDSPI